MRKRREKHLVDAEVRPGWMDVEMWEWLGWQLGIKEQRRTKWDISCI
jgi:hypothetical protein